MDSFNAYIVLQDNGGQTAYIVVPATSGDNAAKLNEQAQHAVGYLNGTDNG